MSALSATGGVIHSSATGGIIHSLFVSPPVQGYDANNDSAYAFHYRNLDSVEYYVQKSIRPMRFAKGYADGVAEGDNNRAFVAIVRMDYDLAEHYLTGIPEITDNQLELLVCYVQQMRLCQRRSRNRDFYEYRQKAERALRRINEERHVLNERQQRRLLYAESELAIVNSTYYYYVGLEERSAAALSQIHDGLESDTAQWLNYLYNVGAGGIISGIDRQDVAQQEFNSLIRCYQIARRGNYPFFIANALESIAEHLIDVSTGRYIVENNAPAMTLLNPDGIAEEELPAVLTTHALDIFSSYGDVYQTAGAYRTLASCHHALGDDASALRCLEKSLADTLVNQAPDLVASIREQLSVVWAALGDKQQSDYNRNIYLDLQEQTRQDRYLEARAYQYERSSAQLNWMLAAVVAAIVLLLFLLWLFNYLSHKQRPDTQLADKIEERQEQIAMARRDYATRKCRNMEQRARISLVNNILPFIDRILHQSSLLPDITDDGERQEHLSYISELTDQINSYNDVLTSWIQLQRGEINLRIESFPLSDVFDIVNRSRTAFRMKDITLCVEPSSSVVKADRVLTLFMLNTLADNARKYTDAGGRVTISAAESADYVEVSVIDTGKGLTPEQQSVLFDRHVILDDSSRCVDSQSASHGFGLLNCKGIIDKYRKISKIFDVCTIYCQSRVGEGSRFAFRLPRGKSLAVLFCLLSLSVSSWSSDSASLPFSSLSDDDLLSRASLYADSAYYSNIDGCYDDAVTYAGTCCRWLNLYYARVRPSSSSQSEASPLLQLRGDSQSAVADLQWLRDSVPLNFNIILNMRNETAVAALALHDWALYSYNNKIYTQLFKELSADKTLADYCRRMQQSEQNKAIAIILLVFVLILILPAYWLLYYRRRLESRFSFEREQRQQLEQADEELRRIELESSSYYVANAVLDNCLSTLKHETMYYPSRIRQLADTGQWQELAEVTRYYRDIYTLLGQQAMRQVESTCGLRLKRLEGDILGDETLIGLLFDTLLGPSADKKLITTHPDSQYVRCHVALSSIGLSADDAHSLFVPTTGHIPYLLCRQIVRDHGEASGRHGCGIIATENELVITLPRYNGKV